MVASATCGEAPLISEYGFDQSLTNFEGLGPRVLPLNDAYDGQPAKKYALGVTSWVESDYMGSRAIKSLKVVVEGAIAFMTTSQAGQPWLVNLWPDDVHSPFFPPPALRAMVKSARCITTCWPTWISSWANCLITFAVTHRLRENTIILLASDNGPEAGRGQQNPLRGAKGELWEGGISQSTDRRSPTKRPDQCPGTVNSSSELSSIDLTRSILGLVRSLITGGLRPDGEPLPAVLLVNRPSRARPL